LINRRPDIYHNPWVSGSLWIRPEILLGRSARTQENDSQANHIIGQFNRIYLILEIVNLILMIDERKYWEEAIAYTFLIFATYTIIKDLLDEDAIPILSTIPITINALIYAGFSTIILFFILKIILNKLKKKEKNDLKEKERI
jgi:hypothetical protein